MDDAVVTQDFDEEMTVADASTASPHLQIAAILRTMILEGRLSPGARLTELELCAQLKVATVPLREALRVLAADNLVGLLPNHSAIVMQIADENMVELFEILEGLEATVGELVAQRVTDAEIEELKSLHAQMLEHYRARRRAEYFAYNQRVHRRLIEITRNRTLARDHYRYSQEIARARYAANFSQTSWGESVQEHSEIVEAVAQRDGILLSKLLREHMRRTARSVLAALGQPQQPTA